MHARSAAGQSASARHSTQPRLASHFLAPHALVPFGPHRAPPPPVVSTVVPLLPPHAATMPTTIALMESPTKIRRMGISLRSLHCASSALGEGSLLQRKCDRRHPVSDRAPHREVQ